MRTIYFVAPVHVSANEECIVPFLKQCSLMGARMAPEHSLGVHVVGVRWSTTHVIRRDEKLVEILLDRYDRRQAIENLEGWQPRVRRVSLEIVFNSVMASGTDTLRSGKVDEGPLVLMQVYEILSLLTL